MYIYIGNSRGRVYTSRQLKNEYVLKTNRNSEMEWNCSVGMKEC